MMNGVEEIREHLEGGYKPQAWQASDATHDLNSMISDLRHLLDRVEGLEEALGEMYEACLNGLGPNAQTMDRARAALGRQEGRDDG